VFLERGRVRAVGSHDELLALPAYAALARAYERAAAGGPVHHAPGERALESREELERPGREQRDDLDPPDDRVLYIAAGGGS
jgi:hypothetical protein